MAFSSVDEGSAPDAARTYCASPSPLHVGSIGCQVAAAQDTGQAGRTSAEVIFVVKRCAASRMHLAAAPSALRSQFLRHGAQRGTEQFPLPR